MGNTIKKKTIKMSKEQWVKIGEKAGWVGDSKFSSSPVEPKHSKLLNKIAEKYLSQFDIKPLIELKEASGVITSDIYSEVEKQFPISQCPDLYKKYPMPTGMENAMSIVVARLKIKLS
jgi:hypothetical protein